MRISDWSSDVCSSDLLAAPGDRCVPGGRPGQSVLDRLRLALEQADLEILGLVDRFAVGLHDAIGGAQHQLAHSDALEVEVVEIGRASCRERVCQYGSISVVAVS